ncbi:hypothetical protein PGQ11_009938 [Apiospora arundinis]|uniref:Uncharacterized protein n=1 Tax=Apiospora arundinis TaxID=335852 RepID=A0ABR2I8V6_9PEZI
MRPVRSSTINARILVSVNGNAFQEAKDTGITEQQMKDVYPPRYFAQGNDDSFGLFTLANYVQGKIEGYPFLPVVLEDGVEIPRGSQPRNIATDPVVVFRGEGGQLASFLDSSPATLTNSTAASAGNGWTAATTADPQDGFEVGKKIPSTSYPMSNWRTPRDGSRPSSSPPKVSAPPAPLPKTKKNATGLTGIPGLCRAMSRSTASRPSEEEALQDGSVNELELSV